MIQLQLTAILRILTFLALGCATPAGKMAGTYMGQIQTYLIWTFRSRFE